MVFIRCRSALNMLDVLHGKVVTDLYELYPGVTDFNKKYINTFMLVNTRMSCKDRSSS